MSERHHGYAETGRPLSEALIDELIATAERGYSLEELRARRGTRDLPPGLNPEEYDEKGQNIRFLAVLTELARERGVPASEVFDEAVRRFVGLTG